MGSKAGKILLATAALAYGFTLMSGFISYLTGAALFPSLIQVDRYIAAANEPSALQPYFTMDIVPLMGVLSALVLAFVLGVGVAKTGSAALKRGLEDFRNVITWVINKSIIPLLPIYIFGIFLDMTVSGQVGGILATFAKIIVVIFILHIFILVLQYCIASIFARNNPLKASTACSRPTSPHWAPPHPRPPYP